MSSLETPPQTWRRLLLNCNLNHLDRNTSTDVEKTISRDAENIRLQKHLHGRGEDCHGKRQASHSPETPPRTRRRQEAMQNAHQWEGNTSTDVEKTRPDTSRRPIRSKHLHGRGEDMRSAMVTFPVRETPPRTWRRLGRRVVPEALRRNTSTDVEKTERPVHRSSKRWKHLHGRGEDSPSPFLPVRSLETPPRTWRRR